MLEGGESLDRRLKRCSWKEIVRAFLCVALMASAFTGVMADTLRGVVVAVQDGDTLTLLDSSKVQHNVRLAGIDAPEKGQPYGNRSKEGLSNLTYMRQAAVEWHKRDRFGRVVGKVIVDSQDVNLAQVASGLAWHYVAYAKEQAPNDRALYSDAEAGARDRHIGLWQDSAPTAPWDYRRAKRDGAALPLEAIRGASWIAAASHTNTPDAFLD